MRRIFISAMALVFGLFTVTALFAFSLSHAVNSEQGDVYYFTDPSNPEDNWMSTNSWTDQAPDPVPCSIGPTPCRINLEPDQELDDFLQQLQAEGWEYEDLVNHDQIDPKP